MGEWDFVRIPWHIGVLTVLAYVLWNNTPSNSYVPTIMEIIVSNLTQKLHLVEEVCSEATNACYYIADLGLLENGRLRVIRQMIMKSLMQYRYTAADLIVPEELSYQNTDTSLWEIDKVALHSTTYELMTSIGFIMEALKFDANKYQSVLMIGLGGGEINNFFGSHKNARVNLTTVELDPNMVTYARKWFGFAESRTNNLYIVDGVVFLKLLAKIEQSTETLSYKYKAILLDACESQRAPVLCPVKSFLEEDVIKNIAILLEDKGVLAVNLLATENVIENEERILNLFKAHFKTCFLLRYSPEQRLLVCSHRENWDFKNQQYFVRNIEIADRQFGFELYKLLPTFSENLQ